MKKIYYDKLDETLYFDELQNGLKVYVLNKSGFQKTYATFTTEYGSIDSNFIVNKEQVSVPDGIAHFLEHKMFEEEEGDIFHIFASNGAQTNAFTSFDRTTYLFSSTSNVLKNLETLINFVQSPYFTEESVEKEKGIIAQEINMYQDNADWRLYFGLLKGLYKDNPIRIDIAGSVDSIHSITKEQLYKCYETFYHPSNMVLFVVSGENPSDIINFVKENQSKKDFTKIPNIERVYPKEVADIHIAEDSVHLAVAIPKVLVGFKDIENGLSGNDFIKRELSTQILLESLFGDSTDFFESLLNENMIDQNFSFEYQLEKHYGFTIIGGNSKDPDRLITSIKEEITSTRKSGLKQTSFETIKRKKIGGILRKMNSPEFIANQFTRYVFNGASLFEVIPNLEELTFEEVNERLKHLDLDQMAIFKVYPTEEQN